MEKLPGDYIAGFVDGEGCFALKFHRLIRRERKNQPVYYYWDVEFIISLREDDHLILELMQNTLACGKISFSKDGKVRLAVNNIFDLSNKIVPFFEQYKLHAKKKYDFELWKEAVSILMKNQRLKVNAKKGHDGFMKTKWDVDDLERLIEIHQAMKPYKSAHEEWKWINEAMSLAA